MTQQEWHDRGVALFGPDEHTWTFICPICRHVASVKDYKDAGAPVTAVGFSCIGRWKESCRNAFETNPKKQKAPGPCNYAGGGLFKLNPVEVDGQYYFEFGPSSRSHDSEDLDKSQQPSRRAGITETN